MRWWETARHQGGVIDIAQLRAADVSHARVDGMVRRGELVAVRPGVYRGASTPLTVKGRRFAAALWSDGVLSYQTAGAMWDVDDSDPADVVHVSVRDRVSRNGHPGFVRVHRVILRAHDVQEVDGLRVTTRSRTTLDLVGSLPRRRARDLFERGAQTSWFTLADLDARLEHEKGRSGNRVLREFREEMVPGAQSEFERRVHRLLIRHEITGWQPQYPVTTATGAVIHADIAFPDHRLILELDGWSTHSGRPQFGNDRRRDRGNLIAGWRTIRFVWGDLDDPATMIAEIRALLAG